MRVKQGLMLAVILGVPTSGALAQPAAEPPLLKLPMGASVRLQTLAAPGHWMKGILVSADSASVALVPEDAPPLGANQLVLPSASVSRFELRTGTKRHWLRGLLAGVAVGVAFGFTLDVDPVACKYDYNYECSRGAAVALAGGTFGTLGAGVGALVKTERWTPVALDALAPKAPRMSGMVPHLRALPRGGVELGVAVGF